MSLSMAQLWNKLPIAESFWLLLRHVWSPESLDEFYDQHRGRHDQRKIAFSEIVAILLEAITLKQGRAYPVLLDQQDEEMAPVERKFAIDDQIESWRIAEERAPLARDLCGQDSHECEP